jgi:hypothetical protein
VGPDGVLSIESSSSFETTVSVEEGMEVSNARFFYLTFVEHVGLLPGKFILFLAFSCLYRSTGVISPHSLSQIRRN